MKLSKLLEKIDCITVNGDLEKEISFEDASKINKELFEMLHDFYIMRSQIKEVYFITPSRFENALKGE